MKTTTHYLSALGLALGLAATGVHAADAPATAETPKAGKANKADRQAAKAARADKAKKKEDRVAVREAKQKDRADKPADAAAAATPGTASAEAAPAADVADIKLDFKGAPLDLVLTFLSEAAGYIIVLETPVRGTIDVFSANPVTKTEAIGLLNTALAKNGLASVVEGRTLTIMSKDSAMLKETPIQVGSVVTAIPKDDIVVTQIIPVKNMSAQSLVTDLGRLIPETGLLSVNQGGNSLIMTDTRRNVRRVAELVTVLDGTVAASSTLRIFPIKFADARALATTITSLYTATAANTGFGGGVGGRGGGGRGGGGGFGGGFGGQQGGLAAFLGGAGGGGFGGAGGAGGGGAAANTRNTTTSARVAAVADEFSNSVIVSAGEEQMRTIERLIKDVDVDPVDLTVSHIFRLQNADPTETAAQITQLFPDPTTQTGGRQGGGGGGGFGNFGRGGGGATATSDRSKKMSKVIAVAEPRTRSLLVTASKEMMPSIAELVTNLDSSNARKQIPRTYNLDNASTAEVEAVLRSLFEATGTRNNQNNNLQNNALQNRINQGNQAQPGGFTQGFGAGGGRGGN